MTCLAGSGTIVVIFRTRRISNQRNNGDYKGNYDGDNRVLLPVLSMLMVVLVRECRMRLWRLIRGVLACLLPSMCSAHNFNPAQLQHDLLSSFFLSLGQRDSWCSKRQAFLSCTLWHQHWCCLCSLGNDPAWCSWPTLPLLATKAPSLGTAIPQDVQHRRRPFRSSWYISQDISQVGLDRSPSDSTPETQSGTCFRFVSLMSLPSLLTCHRSFGAKGNSTEESTTSIAWLLLTVPTFVSRNPLRFHLDGILISSSRLVFGMKSRYLSTEEILCTSMGLFLVATSLISPSFVKDWFTSLKPVKWLRRIEVIEGNQVAFGSLSTIILLCNRARRTRLEANRRQSIADSNSLPS